jgi:glutamate/aspartate transport system substrate-binding protein
LYVVARSPAFLQSRFVSSTTLLQEFSRMKKSIFALAALMATGLAFAQANDTLKKIKDSGAVTMGVRESSGALSYTLGDGKYAGFHVEVCQRVLADIQKGQGLAKLDIRYQPVTSQNRIPLVQNGTVDIECGSTTNNATRLKDVAFAVTTYVEEVRIAVKANSGITSIAQLKDKNVATTTGTTSVQLLRKHERGAGIDFKEVFGKDHADSFLLLETGRADAFVMDGQILAGNIAKSKNPADYRIVGEVLSVEPIAIMIRKDDPGFKKAVDDSLKAMMKSGDIGKLYDKWFMQPIPPSSTKVGLPLSDATKNAWANPNEKPVEEYLKK